MAKVLPLETARRLAQAAIAAIDGDVSAEPDDQDLQSLSSQFSWISVRVRAAINPDGVQHLYESLCVLTLLAACRGYALGENPRFWSEVLPEAPRQPVPIWSRHNWSEPRERTRPRATLRRPRFRIRIDQEPTGSTALAVLEALVAASQQSPRSRSPMFKDALQILKRWILPTCEPESVVCSVKVSPQEAYRAQRLLRACAATVKTTATTTLLNTEGVRLPSVSIDALVVTMQRCDDHRHALMNLSALMGTPVPAELRVESLRLEVGKFRRQELDERAVGALGELLWNVCHGGDSLAKVECWDFDISSPETIPVLASAFPSFSDPHRLKIALSSSDPVTSRLFWQWLALTLFHPSTTSCAHSLEIKKCPLSMEDVKCIAGVMECDWTDMMVVLQETNVGIPASLSQISPAAPPGRMTMVRIKQGAGVGAEPARRFFSWPKLKLKREQTFRVLFKLPDWICIQVPGYGCGYVQRTSIISWQELLIDEDATRVTSLSLDIDDPEATIALLRLVGRSLERLSLSCNRFTNGHIPDLLACCPHLTSLRLRSAYLTDITELVKPPSCGDCDIKSLEVCTPHLTHDCLKAMCSALSNRQAASQCALQELSLGSGHLDRHDLDRLLSMLDTNRTLQLLHVRIPFDLFDDYFPRFRVHRRDQVQNQTEHSRALAFFSAIGYYSKSASPIKNADPDIIASILEYASEGARSISVDEYTDDMSMAQIVARIRHGTARAA